MNRSFFVCQECGYGVFKREVDSKQVEIRSYYESSSLEQVATHLGIQIGIEVLCVRCNSDDRFLIREDLFIKKIYEEITDGMV